MNAQMLFFVCFSALLAGFGIVLMMACDSDRRSWPRSQTRPTLLNELDDAVQAAEILRARELKRAMVLVETRLRNGAAVGRGER